MRRMATETVTAAGESKPISRAGAAIREIFASGRPLLYIRSAEEQRVSRILAEVASRLEGPEPLPVWSWSLS